MTLNICVFGVSGYTGAKLLYFVNRHKKVNLVGVFGKSTEGQKLSSMFPNLTNLQNLVIKNHKKFDFKNVDLIFSCLPHGEFQQKIFPELDPNISIIDLSGDFRIKDFKKYELFYDIIHKSKDKRNNFTYGLSEIYKDEIRRSKFVSNPGCYPTSILLPLLPLLKKGILDKSHIIIDSKSGMSGAGKKPKNKNLYSELENNFFSYNIEKHKHIGEIDQELKKYNKNITFTFIPHILPVFSGIQSNIYLDNSGADSLEVLNVLKDFYKNEPFIKFFSKDIPKLSDVQNTNDNVIKVFSDFKNKKIIIISCLDNLIKGAAGQAIQNMNLMFGFDQTESLTQK
tara:strand:+ start:413 stop:1432 length:1020 start_codon:yes stop_codon:yes gene_type:complete